MEYMAILDRTFTRQSANRLTAPVGGRSNAGLHCIVNLQVLRTERGIMKEWNQSSIEPACMEEVHQPMAFAPNQTHGLRMAPIVSPFNEFQGSLNQLLEAMSDRDRREQGAR